MSAGNSNSTVALLMAKNPVKDPVFQKTLKNLLSAKPKPQSEMKVGKKKKTKKAKAAQK
jgi:hypothetical protein